MTYQEYIDLGFKRTEWNDSVHLKNTGYGGFYLEKMVSDRILCTVEWNELDHPKLLIGTEEKCNRVSITPDDVRMLFKEPETGIKFNFA